MNQAAVNIWGQVYVLLGPTPLLTGHWSSNSPLSLLWYQFSPLSPILSVPPPHYWIIIQTCYYFLFFKTFLLDPLHLFPNPTFKPLSHFFSLLYRKKTFWKSWVFWLSLISFSFRFLLDHSSQAFSPAAPSQWLLSRLSVSSMLLNPLVSLLSCSHLTYQKHSTLLIFPFSWKCSLHLTSRILVTESRPCFSHWQLYPSSYSSWKSWNYPLLFSPLQSTSNLSVHPTALILKIYSEFKATHFYHVRNGYHYRSFPFIFK